MLVADNVTPLPIISTPGGRSVQNRGPVGPIRVRELSATTLLIAAFGAIDAANAGEVSGSIERHLSGYWQLVLDFSRLDFFGTAGYSALHRVYSRCRRVGVDWVLVPGPEVERLTRICDPDMILPTAPNIVSAVAALARNHSSAPRRRTAHR